MKKHFLLGSLMALALTSLTGCYLHTATMRQETADNLASANHFQEKNIEVNGTVVTIYENSYKPGQPARIFIAGEGPTGFWSYSDTPVNHTALHIATRDTATNRIFMGRPCQYNFAKLSTPSNGCKDDLSGDNRYSPEVIAAMSGALDVIKKRYGLTGFELVGYQGGGVIALALALDRNDVINVRTIDTPLDTYYVSSLMPENENLSGSVNPVGFASRISQVPQIHFFDDSKKTNMLEQEKTLPYTAMIDRYASAAGNTQCMSFHKVNLNDDSIHYPDQWKALLTLPLDCNNP
jgi:hypothetical protein